MPRKGYRTITLRDETVVMLEYGKKAEESWDDYLQRLYRTLGLAIELCIVHVPPAYAKFAKFKELVTWLKR